jgi:hypothetical protein
MNAVLMLGQYCGDELTCNPAINMTGANYTGGKRNAARDRSRDASGRLQRGYFSRQRLNLLANGLVPRSLETLHNHISLKHARLDEKKSQVAQGLVEPAAEFPCFEPSSARRSRVLEMLDTEERRRMPSICLFMSSLP